MPYKILFGLPANSGPVNTEVQYKDLRDRWNKISVDVVYNNDKARREFRDSKSETSEEIQGGTMVYVPNPKRENKLDDVFVGPYTVVDVLPYGNLLLDIESRVNQNQCRFRRDEIKEGCKN